MPHVHKPKDNRRARRYLSLGATASSQGAHQDALIYLNKSLCLAESGSGLITKIFKARSDIYDSMKNSDKCSENKKLARDSQVPKEAVSQSDDGGPSLANQQQQQAENSGAWDFFKLKYPSRQNYPTISNCLELQKNEALERIIVTNQDLEPGDVIAIEETPFKALYTLGHPIYRCANCFNSNEMSLIPDDDCALAMFCSQECLNYSKNKYMCNVDDHLSIVPRIVCEAIDMLGGDVSRLKPLTTDSTQSSLTVFDLALSNPADPDFKYNRLLALNALEEKQLDADDELAINTHPVLNRWPSLSDKNIVKAYMQKIAKRSHAKISSFPPTQIRSAAYYDSDVDQDGYAKDVDKGDRSYLERAKKSCVESEFGFSIFPFFSMLISSSRLPFANVHYLRVCNKLVAHVSLPIKKGEQISM